MKRITYNLVDKCFNGIKANLNSADSFGTIAYWAYDPMTEGPSGDISQAVGDLAAAATTMAIVYSVISILCCCCLIFCVYYCCYKTAEAASDLADAGVEIAEQQMKGPTPSVHTNSSAPPPAITPASAPQPQQYQ